MVRCVLRKHYVWQPSEKTKKVSHYLEIRKNKQDKSIRRMYILGYEKKRQIVARQEARENVKKI